MDGILPHCPVHLHLKQVFYCVECEELLCRRCMMDNHKAHNYDETEVVLCKRTDRVKDLLGVAESLFSEGGCRVSFSDLKAKLVIHHKQLIKDLGYHFDTIRKQITDRENYLLTCLQIIVDREYVHIEATEKEFTQLSGKFQVTIANAQKLLKERGSISCIADSKVLSQDLEAKMESINKVCNPAVLSDKRVQLVFKDEANKAFVACLEKLGEFVDAKELPCQDNSSHAKLSRNLSLPTLSSLSMKPSAPSNNDTSSSVNCILPAAVISCTEKGKKFYPCGIAAGSNNLITVSDLHNNFVKVLTGTGKVIDTIESSKGSHALRGPCALDVDKDNNIYVLERENKSIGKYTNGSFNDLGKFKQFNDPRGILVCRDKVYITDWGKNCIHVLTLTYNKLGYLSTIGESVLKQPAGIACDSSKEKIVVCDQDNHCVWVLTPEGDVLSVIGGDKGNQLGRLNVPYGVAVTGDGKVVVSEKGNSRLSVFSLDGLHLLSFGLKGCAPGQFNQLRHICTNFNKQVLVADELNQRVQIFDI